MWMGLATGGIRLYKHGLTRRYLNLCLDPGGEVLASRYTGKGYVRMPLAEAIEAAFAGIEELAGVYRSDPRATPYDHEYRALRDRKLRELAGPWSPSSTSSGRSSPTGLSGGRRSAHSASLCRKR